MNEVLEPAGIARRLLLRRVIGTGIVILIGSRMAVAADAQVVIDNFTFSPTPLKVKAGTTVTWVNHDDMPHSIVCPALKVHSHALDTDDSFAYKFDQAGTYDYLCGIHPHMRSARGDAPREAKQGRIEIVRVDVPGVGSPFQATTR